MAKFDINLSKLEEVTLDKMIGDPTLGPGIADVTLNSGDSIELDQVVLSWDADAQAGLALFNSPDDLATDYNNDGVLGMGEKEEDPSLISSQIMFDKDKAWLKYSLQAKAKTSAGYEGDKFGWNAGANLSLMLDSYRYHEVRGKTLKDAIQADISPFKTVFNWEDLNLNEAVTLKVDGELSGKVSTDWAKIFSTSLNPLAGLIKKNEALKIGVDSGLSAGFGWSIKGVFMLVITKIAGNKYRLAIKKSREVRKDASLGFGISVGLEQPEALENLVDNFITGLVGEDFGTIKNFLTEKRDEILKTALNASGSLKKPIEYLLKVFKLEDLTDERIDKLIEKLEELHKSIKKAIQDISEYSLKAGLLAQYSHTKMETSLLEFIVSPEILEKNQGKLILFKTGDLLRQAESGTPGIELTRFFHEEKVKISHSWGFNLGFGKWSIAAMEKDDLVVTERKIKQGDQEYQKNNYQFSKSFVDIKNDKTTTINVNFSTEMNKYLPKKHNPIQPLAADFDTNFLVSFEWGEDEIDTHGWNRIIDNAIIWHALPLDPGKNQSIIKELKSKECTRAVCKIVIAKEDFKPLLPMLQTLDTVKFGKALAAAMPYMKDHIFRNDISKRKQFYGAYWKMYLDECIKERGDIAVKVGKCWDYANNIVTHLKRLNEKELARVEFHEKGKMPLHPSFQYFMEKDRPYYSVRQLQKGFEALGASQSSLDIKSVWEKIHDYLNVRFLMRAFGVYLMEIAQSELDLFNKIERILTVVYQEEGTEKVLNFTTSSL